MVDPVKSLAGSASTERERATNWGSEISGRQGRPAECEEEAQDRIQCWLNVHIYDRGESWRGANTSTAIRDTAYITEGVGAG